MATTVDVIVNVKDGELQGLDSQLNKVAGSLDRVDKEAKQASKSVDDVAGNGGAIAILDQLTGGLATRFRDAYEATKLFNFSLKGTRTALIATGVGAFLVALGAVVAYWDDIVAFVTRANEKLQEQINLNDRNLKALDVELKVLEEKEKQLKLEGKSNEEIKKAKIDIIQLQQQENIQLLENLKIQLERERSQAEELSWWQKLINLRAGIAVTQSKITEEEQARIDGVQEQIDNAILRGEQLKTTLLELQTAAPSGGGEARQQRGDLSAVSELDSTGVMESPEVTAAMNTAEAINSIEEDLQARRAGRRQQELLEEQILNDQKLALTQQTLGAIIQILGRNSAAGKAAAIAQAVINTYQGVTEVWSSESILPEPLATAQRLVSTATVLASGLQSVQAIKSTQLPAFASGGGGFGGGVQAPAFNVVGQSPVNQLAETLQNQNEPIRAYVVGSDVSTQQSLDRNITETATIG